jgi:hypothetical protein
MIFAAFNYFPRVAAYGKKFVGCPQPGVTFPFHMMFGLFALGYFCEYQSVGSKLSLLSCAF